MVKIEVECELIEHRKEVLIIPSYQFVCPYCKSRQIFEKDLMHTASAFFCAYCKQKLQRKR